MTKKKLTPEEALMENKAARLNGILGFGLDEASVQLTLEILNSEETKSKLERFDRLMELAQRKGFELNSDSFRNLRRTGDRMGYEAGRCELEDVWEEFEKSKLQ